MFDFTQDALRNNDDAEHMARIGDILIDTYDDIESMGKDQRHFSWIPTGFADLDSILTGLSGGELIVVGARHAMGKTSFALNLVSNAAIQSRKGVVLFSMEMPRYQAALRILCSVARVDLQKIRRGDMTDEIQAALADAFPAVSSAPIYIDDTPGLTPCMLGSRCRELKKEDKLDLIVIDYIGLMQPDVVTGSQYQDINAICHALKAIALELDVPLLVCSQLARPGKDRTDRYPVLNDLRVSGSLESDADVVLLLHRDDYYGIKSKEQEICDVIVAKHRNGPLGIVKLIWLPQSSSFANLSAE